MNLTANASRLGLRIQETITEHARELNLSVSSNAALFDTPETKINEIRQQLDGSSDRETLEGLKRLIAMISKGRDVSQFFAQVVKNVASHNLEIRKLVYIYILRYAESEPDLALLSINTFQKDLTDSNPLIRAMALRVLSSVRVPLISSIVVLAIKKSCADVSPYVRKTAALAIPKCFSLDGALLRELLPCLVTLLADRSPLSIGATAAAFNIVCPSQLDLLHQHYRRLCRTLLDADEWGQTNLLELLSRYARCMLPAPVIKSTEHGLVEIFDRDLQLLLTSAESLLMSHNPAVVAAAARTLYYLGLSSQHEKTISPLLRCLHTSNEIERIILEDLLTVASKHPNLLSGHYTRFFVRSFDGTATKRVKMHILLALLSESSALSLLKEFETYAHDFDDTLVEAAVLAIGQCGRRFPHCTERCISSLLSLVKGWNDSAGSTAVRVLRSFVQTNFLSPGDQSLGFETLVPTLAEQFDDIVPPRARGCVLWLVGQYSPSATAAAIPGVNDWAADVLRRAVKSFVDEVEVVKLQTLTLAAKLLALAPTHESLRLLSAHVFHLARYDSSYDVRDRGRLLASLVDNLAPSLLTTYQRGDEESLGSAQGTVSLRSEQIKMALFQGKGQVNETRRDIGTHRTMGSLEAVTLKHMGVSRSLPDWLSAAPNPSLRDTEEDRIAVTGSVVVPSLVEGNLEVQSSPGRTQKSNPTRGGDLDAFYSEGEDETEGSEESESEDEQESSLK